MYQREISKIIEKRLEEPRKFIQILAGPRQVGKTTMIQAVLLASKTPSHYASADSAEALGRGWLEQQWEVARALPGGAGILVVDEIQKISNWAETVKKCWDADTRAQRRLHVVLLGSSQILIQKGLTESLTGRFEVIRVTHWGWPEMRDAFGFSLDQYLFFGGYPGAASLVGDENRWREYVQNALVETTISKDILMLVTVTKPALLRNLFFLGCAYSGQILTYQKMIGQLQDVGNTTTLAHYLTLLQSAGLLAGLEKLTDKEFKKRASSPKLLALNDALVTATSSFGFTDWKADGTRWGRLVETAVGNHLYNSALGMGIQVGYWREGDREIDFVLGKGDALTAIEVKSGHVGATLPGMDAFAARFHVTRKLLVGTGGIPIEEFLARPTVDWL